MSPVASAARTSVSGTSLPRLTRSSYGLFASSGVSPMERPVDDVHLLLTRQSHEIHGVARDADRQARILLGMIHRVEQRVAVQHVDVHVVAGAREERVEDPGEIV